MVTIRKRLFQRGSSMDINQLKNFIEIVESNFNISETSKKVHISQPALSKMILNFERDENILLFERSNGRLKSLTPAGESFYYDAVELTKQYEGMMDDLRDASGKLRGRIRIGIPPLVNTILFTDILPRMILENPNIQFCIVEMGAFELRKSLILQELDIAVLLRPSDLKENNIQEVLIADNDLCAFMSSHHKLAQKGKLDWSDLNNQPMAIFSEDFMIHHYLMRKFESENIKPNIKLESRAWDYLLHATEKSELITVIPSPISNFCSLRNLAKVEFNDPINWEVILCRKIKEHYTGIENHVFRCISEYFNATSIHKRKSCS
jgi:DNA-binding transcriptional LysR family regulator